MKKLFSIIKDLLFLSVVVASHIFHIAIGFCNMRGPHPKDICDLYAGRSTWLTSYMVWAMIAHWLIAGAIVVDILFILFSEKRRLFRNKSQLWITSLLLGSGIIWFSLIHFI